MENQHEPGPDDRIIPVYRHVWREATTGQAGGGNWHHDLTKVKAAAERVRADYPAREIWLETRELQLHVRD